MTRTARRARSIAGAWSAAVLVHAALLAGAYAMPLRTRLEVRAADEPAFAIRVSRSSLPELFVEPQPPTEAPAELPVEPPLEEPGIALVPPPEPELALEQPTAALIPAPVVAEVIEEPAPASDAPVQSTAAVAAETIGVGVGDAAPQGQQASSIAAAPAASAAPGAGSEGVAGATGNAESTSTGRGTAAIAVGPTRAVRPLTNPKPVYPRTSIRFREEGEVLCRLEIDARGFVTAVAVARSSGSKRLDDAAVDAVKRWTFEPALRDGVAEATTATLPVVFRLRDAR
ncbi:MAG: energy transducer TonB [Planctomycetota bacterium]|nr:MAG: energy transducer TonB [Planctomycetota bacterium]